MVFAELLEAVLMCAVLLALATQILIPLLRGTPFFPIFGRERKLTQELAKAEEEVRAAELESKIGTAKRRADQIRSRESRKQ